MSDKKYSSIRFSALGFINKVVKIKENYFVSATFLGGGGFIDDEQRHLWVDCFAGQEVKAKAITIFKSQTEDNHKINHAQSDKLFLFQGFGLEVNTWESNNKTGINARAVLTAFDLHQPEDQSTHDEQQ